MAATLATFLKSASRQLTGIAFEANPCLLTIKESEFSSWKTEQERILGVKFVYKKGHSTSESSSNRMFVWRKKYLCHRSGKPRPYVSTVSPSKRRKLQAESIKCGCEAYFIVKKLIESVDDEDMVAIDYHWEHTGHTPASTDHTQHVGLTHEVRYLKLLVIYFEHCFIELSNLFSPYLIDARLVGNKDK
jgi:hypothetical protein